MTDHMILLPILIPLAAALLILLVSKRFTGLKEAIALIATFATAIIAVSLFKSDMTYSLPWAGFGMDFSLRIFHFSASVLLATSIFAFLFTIYSCSFMFNKPHVKQFYFYLLLTVSMVHGALLSDNLVLLLFFWEGMLLTLFGMIAIGGMQAFKTATKAFIIVGITDLCFMFGIGLVYYLTGTLEISKINLPLTSISSLAFIFLMIGAISKAGCMPFHSWIPDAAIDAPLPFMAFLPASYEKLIGIYFLARITLDMYKLDPASWLSTMLMIIGAVTILFAVMMALIQKDYKKLLAYHAISQVGYMVLGIGTCVPAGIIGGLFHTINNALYKSGLFLTGGSVEKQTGTTNLAQLGGLASRMPITFICFLIVAASISGVPPFNGFFSKELVYDGALERHIIFYIAAVLGSFFTAASFLKLGHAAYLGKISDANCQVKEAPWSMLLPTIVIAAACIIFGVFSSWPLRTFIIPVLGEFEIPHPSIMLIATSVIVLFAALVHHLFAARLMGSGLKASDHIRHAPLLECIYDRAEKRFFDPYDIGLKIVNVIAKAAWSVDRAIDWIYDGFSVLSTKWFSENLMRLNTGNYSMYIVWSLFGLIIVLLIMTGVF